MKTSATTERQTSAKTQHNVYSELNTLNRDITFYPPSNLSSNHVLDRPAVYYQVHQSVQAHHVISQQTWGPSPQITEFTFLLTVQSTSVLKWYNTFLLKLRLSEACFSQFLTSVVLSTTLPETYHPLLPECNRHMVADITSNIKGHVSALPPDCCSPCFLSLQTPGRLSISLYWLQKGHQGRHDSLWHWKAEGHCFNQLCSEMRWNLETFSIWKRVGVMLGQPGLLLFNGDWWIQCGVIMFGYPSIGYHLSVQGCRVGRVQPEQVASLSQGQNIITYSLIQSHPHLLVIFWGQLT